MGGGHSKIRIMKKIHQAFYRIDPAVENTGLKYVLWAIADIEGNITHDWGFADWNGKEWEPIEVPEGYMAKVAWWANTVDPELLLKEESKIVSPHTAPVKLETGLSGGKRRAK